jgi:hypothetical protein
MSKIIVEEDVNIDLDPISDSGAVDDNIDGIEEITSGDLHANAIRLIYFLIRHGVCQIEPADYNALTVIYQLPEIDEASLHSFKTIISRLKVVNTKALVRLIGDEVADRGQNDYFILKILEKLSQEGARVEILLSNHGVEFIEACERFTERGRQLKATTLLETHNASFLNLAKLVSNNLVLADEILSLYEKIYSPMLKLLSYNLDEDPHGITIYTHAVVGLETLRRLAQKFMVTFEDESPETLATTIDAINEKFKQAVKGNIVHTLYNPSELEKGYSGQLKATQDNAIEYLIWNRNSLDLERPSLHKGYALSFVHGHDAREPTAGNIINLDSMVGKVVTYHQGQYRSLTTIKPLRPKTDIPLLNVTSEEILGDLEKRQFTTLLEKLFKKALDLKSRKEENASLAAFKLHRDLQFASKIYFKTPSPEAYEAFKNFCTPLLKNAHKSLDKHRGFKNLLLNITLLVLGLGIVYLAALVVNHHQRGNCFSFFNTESHKLVGSIDDSILQLKPSRL